MKNTLKSLILVGIIYVLLDKLTTLTNSENICLALFLFSVLFVIDVLVVGNVHSKKYEKLYNSFSNDLSAFDKNNATHLRNLYKFISKYGGKVKDESSYLGENKVTFAYPLKFLKDSNNILKRMVADIDYIKMLNGSAINKIEKENIVLYSNTFLVDLYKKERMEFFLENMKICQARDNLLKIYETKFNTKPNFKVMTTQESELKEKLKNMPNHLKEDMFKGT